MESKKISEPVNKIELVRIGQSNDGDVLQCSNISPVPEELYVTALPLHQCDGKATV
jgi:hypothetical protein